MQTALSEGADLVTGGGAPADDSLRQGYWYVPAVLRNVRPDMTVMREETFGPVTPVLAVSSVDQAIHAHHAGYRESGIGGEDGKWGLLRHTQVKTAYHHSLSPVSGRLA